MREKTDQWDVRFVGWKDFAEAVVSREGDIWNLLTNTDVLIGGVNFTSNFL